MDIHHLERIDVPLSLVLAILATLGYVFGTLVQRKKANSGEVVLRLKKDLARAKTAVHELGKVISAVHSSTNKHMEDHV